MTTKPQKIEGGKKTRLLKRLSSVIQICPKCGKVDVAKGHEKECDQEYEQIRQNNMEYYD